MRFSHFLLASALCMVPGYILADKLNPCEPDIDAYISLLNAEGYEVVSYDIRPLVDESYNIRVVIQEYKGDSLINDGSGYPFNLRNRTMLSAFSEENIASIRKEEMYDADKGIYSAGERINIGFLPARPGRKGGKEITMLCQIPGMGTVSLPLKLRPQRQPGADNESDDLYSYHVRPFKASEIVTDKFIPLALLGSAWLDPQFNIFRFCGESEIDPDYSSTILKYIPHYYIIGVIISKRITD